MSDRVSTRSISKSPPLPRARTPVKTHKNANRKWTDDEKDFLIGNRHPDRRMPYRAIGKLLGRSAQACRLVMHSYRTGKMRRGSASSQSTPASTPSLAFASTASSPYSSSGQASQSTPFPRLVPAKATSTWTLPNWRPAGYAQPAQSFGGMEMAPQPAPMQTPYTPSAHGGAHYYHQPTQLFVGPPVQQMSPAPGMFYTNGQPLVYNAMPMTQQYYSSAAGHGNQAPPAQSPLTPTQVPFAYGMGAAETLSTYGHGPHVRRTRGATSSPAAAPVAQDEINAAYTSAPAPVDGDDTTAAPTPAAATATINGDIRPFERSEAEIKDQAQRRRRQELHNMWK